MSQQIWYSLLLGVHMAEHLSTSVAIADLLYLQPISFPLEPKDLSLERIREDSAVLNHATFNLQPDIYSPPIKPSEIEVVNGGRAESLSSTCRLGAFASGSDSAVGMSLQPLRKP